MNIKPTDETGDGRPPVTASVLVKPDGPRRIDRVIHYFGEPPAPAPPPEWQAGCT